MFGRKARRIVELEQLLALQVGVNNELAEEIAELDARNAALHAKLHRLTNRPYVTWNDPTPPRQAPGSEELADSEAPVVACIGCGQPSGTGHVCGNEIKEAA